MALLGHVDHGKTTLLDRIRSSNVQGREAGGITQSIGASVIKTKEGKTITFIDTPGHAAFLKMRSHGASAADIALLVVAANDGVKPQTKEALKHIRKAKIPFIVVITKSDLPSVNIENTKKQLEGEEVQLEGQGGDVPLVVTSGKNGKGIDELLETIILLAEVNELSGDLDGDLKAIVIETMQSKGGPLVSIVVKEGKLMVGDSIVAGNIEARVKGMFNDKGEREKEVLPGEPSRVLGFKTLPEVGVVVSSKSTSLLERSAIKDNRKKPKVEEGQLAFVVKTSSTGALDAVLFSLPEGVIVVGSGVGEVNKADVLLAKDASAKIFTFGAKIPKNTVNLAVTEGVDVKSFEIIYELIEAVEEEIKAGLVEELGRAEIVDEFPYNKKRVAGCRVLAGKIQTGKPLILEREGEKVNTALAVSLRKQKQKVSIVKQGEEFGVILKPQLDFTIGDMLVSVAK